MATDVNFGTQHYSQFHPRSIPNCALWLDAADSDTITLSGSSVTAWNDKSGNNRNATGGVSPTRGTNGVVFNGTSQYLATTYSAVPTAETFFGVATWTGTTDRNYCIIGTSATNGRDFNVLRSGATVSIRWDRWGVSGYAPTTGVQTSVRFLATGVFTGTAGQTILNGGTLSASASFSFAGTGITRIGTGVLADYFTGTINEIIVYNRTLTALEYRQVEGYLAAKWALQTRLPISHPFKRFAPALRLFQPVDPLNCAIWVDPADRSSILALSGNQPTSIRSKGHQIITLDNAQPVNNASPGGTYTAKPPPAVTNYGTVFMTNTSSNLNTFQFTRTTGSGGVYGGGYNGSYLRIPSVTFTSQQRTMFFVHSPQAVGIDNYAHIFAPTNFSGTTNMRQRGFLDYGSTGYVMFPVTTGGSTQTLVTGATAPYTGTMLTNGTPYIFGMRHTTSTTSNYTSINGNQLTPPTNQALSTGYLTGTDEYVIGIFFAYTRQFLMGDFLLYDGPLLTTEIQQVEGYLAWKWGLRGNLPATHPYRNFPPTTVPFVPTMFTGCALWLDGGDQAAMSQSVPPELDLWYDKSGNARNATPWTLTYPTVSDTGPVFNGTTVFTTTTYTAEPTVETIFCVATWTGTADGNYCILGPSAANGRGFTVLKEVASTSITWDTWGVARYARTTGVQSGVRFLARGTFASSAAQTSRNGGTLSTSETVSFSGAGVTYIGGGVAGEQGYVGTLHEIVVYSTTLTTAQSQKVEGYLAWKWGLQANLPDSHPYYKIRP